MSRKWRKIKIKYLNFFFLPFCGRPIVDMYIASARTDYGTCIYGWRLRDTKCAKGAHLCATETEESADIVGCARCQIEKRLKRQNNSCLHVSHITAVSVAPAPRHLVCILCVFRQNAAASGHLCSIATARYGACRVHFSITSQLGAGRAKRNFHHLAHTAQHTQRLNNNKKRSKWIVNDTLISGVTQQSHEIA